MRFFASVIFAALFAASTEARACRSNASSTRCDDQERYAKCRFVDARSAPRTKEVRPRGYLIGKQTLPADPVTLEIELKGLNENTAYTVDILSVESGTTTINRRSCKVTDATGAVVAPTVIQDDVFSATTDSRGKFDYATADVTSFSIHRDLTLTPPQQSDVADDEVFAAIYDGTDMVACCELQLEGQRSYNRIKAKYVAP